MIRLTKKTKISIIEKMIEKYNNRKKMWGICLMINKTLSEPDSERFIKTFLKRYYSVFPNESRRKNDGYFFPFGFSIRPTINSESWVHDFYYEYTDIRYFPEWNNTDQRFFPSDIFITVRKEFLENWLKDLKGF
jgi:hypothetical protein